MSETGKSDKLSVQSKSISADKEMLGDVIDKKKHELKAAQDAVLRHFITPCARISLLAGVPQTPLLAPCPTLTLPERVSSAAVTSDSEESCGSLCF